MQFDDDYTRFDYMFDDKDEFTHVAIKNMDGIVDAMLKYYKSIDALSIAMAQGGDFIG
jgi:hypothetical protein